MTDAVFVRPTAHAFALHGARAIADVSGVLVLPEHATLIVSDLHFEKGSSYAERGQMLPPYDTAATVRRLAGAIAAWRPGRVIALGDSFHDLRADGRMAEGDADAIRSLVASVGDWVWIEGNHDPAPPPGFGGTVKETLQIGALILRHEPTEGDAPGEVAGHLHPCAKVTGRGRSVRRRCFATDGSRIVLPSFGAYTGGLNVRDEAFTRCFGGAPDALVMGSERIYPVTGKRLAADGPSRAGFRPAARLRPTS